jgi:hypothetical protein
MTPADHAQRIRELEFKLYKAEHGMGMPYSREDVAHYRHLLAEALDAAAADFGWLAAGLRVAIAKAEKTS